MQNVTIISKREEKKKRRILGHFDDGDKYRLSIETRICPDNKTIK